ncbi:hypothetical protein LPTSP3_g05420 [Leptospira kobayashii]|uniref:Lipoprotein n=1 Tax=Leptospira kobayashii TaxID=1917830 RepID=A0ABN6K9I6_9LEPT|nr:hypothetical protein LPTSP3_g05420 [Leptospira kobayashii]
MGKNILKDHSPHCGVSGYLSVSSSEPLYSGRDYWLDYIKNDGKDYFSASNSPCDGTETGGYSACIHAGEMRSVRVSWGQLSPNSCEGYSANDSESAFLYACSLHPDGGIRLTSTSLLPGKRLGDLVDSNTLRFKPIQIFVYLNGNLVGKSEPAVWWKNPIYPFPVTGGILGKPYDLYYIGSDTNVSNTTTFNSPKLGVIQSSSSVVNVSAVDWLVFNGSFPYLEGLIQGSSPISVVTINSSSRFAYVREVSINSASGSMFAVYGSMGMYRNLRLFGGGSSAEGIKVSSSGTATEANVFKSVLVGGADSNAISLYVSATGSKIFNQAFSDITIFSSSSAEAFMVGNAGSAEISGFLTRELTIANAGLPGFVHQTSATVPFNHITDMNMGFINNSSPVFNLYSTSTTDMDAKVLNVASLIGNFETTNVSNSYFSGNLKVSVGASCTVAGGLNPGIVTTTCAKNGYSDFDLYSNLSSSDSFVGQVVQDDNKNSYDVAGYYPSASVPNEIRFYDSMQNPYRAWGNNDSSTAYTPAMRGNCGGICRIYDWSLRNSDTVLRNANPCPDPAKPMFHTISGAGNTDQVCSSFLRGAKTASGNICQIIHLRNAVEILGDGSGNENLFCESGEDCLYTPNIASYQGHGKLVKASSVSPTHCTDIGSGNLISNVRLFQYETNGY